MRSFWNNRILTLLFCLAIFGMHAQTYPFSNYTVENGLSQTQILTMFQDDEGVMWFGSSGGGITKFDGHFYEYINDKDGLADNVVFCIVKDPKGRILIGTNNGLSVYDPKAGTKDQPIKIKNFTTKDGLSHNRIFSIYFDVTGTAFLATGKGMSTFKDNICKPLAVTPDIDSAAIYSVVIDSKRHYWYSTLGSGVFCKAGEKIKNYSTKDGIQNDVIFSVLERDANTTWLLTGEGLYEIKDEKIRQIKDAGNTGNSAAFYGYLIDKDKDLWINTSEGVIKHVEGDKFVSFKKKNGLDDGIFWKIIQDKELNLWFASDQNGVFKLSSERFKKYSKKDGILSDEIKRIYQNKAGEYWLGTIIGISNFSENKITNYVYEQLKGSPDIWAIKQDKNGNYLIGTSNGMYLFDGLKFKRIRCKDFTSPMNTILDIYIDSNDMVWLATQTGLAKIENGDIVPDKTIPLPPFLVNSVFQDKRGTFWICTDGGLYSYDGIKLKTYSEKDGFNAKRVRSGVVDADNNYWFATNSGVYKYDNTKFTNVIEKLGLPTMEVYAMTIDKAGNIWIGLSNSIAKIQPSNGDYKIRLYDANDGFTGQVCSQNAMIIDNNGQLVIGASSGLVFYDSKYDRDNLLEPKTKLRSIDLFFQKTNWGTYSDSIGIDNIPYKLELPYDKNYLTFNFIGISLTTPEKVSYKYMLSGFDKDWRTTSKTEASYSNIPPGKYTFRLMANNGEGIWNKEPIEFTFTINPPFWRTWWFYSLIALIILSGIYSYLKIRNANTKILKQNEIIEEKNGALLDANAEIAEKNRNITDSINYAKRLQRSFLTSEKILDKILKDHFILFKPRDIVSGDFYLAFDMPDRTMIVCADCTGHGIPGAFMSLIGISMLNEISRTKTNFGTAEVLEQLRGHIIAALNPEKSESGGKDGMDVSLISIFKKSENGAIKIQFSGANNSIYIVTGSASEPQMIEYKGDKQPVGYYSNMKPFTQHEIIAQKGDTIYLYTDGYADQFGGLNGKKFMSKQLKGQLMSIYHLPLKEQKERLDEALKSWQGRLEQVDDVTVIGIKLLD